VPGGLLADAAFGELDRPDETKPVGLLATRLQVGVGLSTPAEPQDRFPGTPWTQLAPQRRGVGLESDQFLALIPTRLTQHEAGTQHVVGRNPTFQLFGRKQLGSIVDRQRGGPPNSRSRRPITTPT